MNREQAKREIDSLDFYLQNHTDDYGEESHTAMMMAIEALNQEPCEDAVSRQVAIDALKQAYWDKDMQNAKDDPCIVDAMTDWAIRTIKDLPSVKPQYTEDEIQKIQELEQAEIQKAYELGKTEGQKSEDAISRQAAIDAMYVLCDTGETLKENPWRDNPHIDAVVETIEQIPSVNPQPKTGHWILLDECSNSGYYCSECHKKLVKEGWSGTVKKIKYCPNCGCRIVEPQESEDKA